jgi:transcriptional regulator of acetoin/glycerol metabolism
MSTNELEIQAEHVQISAARPLPRLAALGPDDAVRLLQEQHGNVSAAARAAGVPRSTFRAWLVRPAHEVGESELPLK